VLAIQVDDPERQARAFLQSHGATYPAALDPGLRVANRFGFKRAPYTVIVNKRGEIAARLDATANESHLVSAIEAALKPPARGARPPRCPSRSVDLAIFLRGLIIGLSIAAPVGPIGVLCIRRTLSDGRAIGFASGLGAATADAVYGAVAAFGLSLVTNALVEQRVWLQAGGGVFLCYLGVRTWMAVPRAASGASADGRGLAAAWASTFALTLTNPTTIISFAAIFAGLGLGRSVGGYRPAS
jgi:hypothetical protein